MFSLFKKKPLKVRVIDHVFASVDAKNKSVLRRLRLHPETMVVAWFNDSLHGLNEMLLRNGIRANAYLAREFSGRISGRQPVIFYEHFPLSKKEQLLFERIGLTEAECYSALDEPLFSRFGGKKIQGLLAKMGMDPDEMIQHPLVSSSIRRAQERVQKRVNIDVSGFSQRDWLRKNLFSE